MITKIIALHCMHFIHNGHMWTQWTHTNLTLFTPYRYVSPDYCTPAIALNLCAPGWQPRSGVGNYLSPRLLLSHRPERPI